MTALTATSRGFLEHLRIALRLTARNRMALVYGYGFPLFFLLSFLVLYRLDDPPLIRHMGELLTIGALGGACFGLPTSLVGDRERGVLRRFRLTPMPAGALLTGTLIARYLVVLSAALCQLGLSMAIGRWLPAHPIGLLVACSFVIFALLGLGLVLAAMADTVPAVQALGQCIFLPMLILGGVAVKLEALPAWVLPLSAFIPGRYAVEAIQACTNGDGLTATRFQLVALLTIGAAACVAGVRLFRWDSGQRFASVPNKSWIAVALAAWIVVGAVAIRRGELLPQRARVAATQRATPAPAEAPSPSITSVTIPTTVAVPPNTEQQATVANALPSSTPAPPSLTTTAPRRSDAHDGWRALTQFDFAALAANQVPPDDGNVSPMASDDEAPIGSSAMQLKRVVDALPKWRPGHVPDRVERVRNYLFILAVADYAQSPVERFLPGAVLTHMLTEFPAEDLVKLVCSVAQHSDEADVSVLSDPLLVDLGAANLDRDELRTRIFYYGVKLTRKLMGR